LNCVLLFQSLAGKIAEPREMESGHQTQDPVVQAPASEIMNKLDAGKSSANSTTLPLRCKDNLAVAGDSSALATSADAEEGDNPEEQEDYGEILHDLPPTEQKKKKKKRSKKPKNQRGLVGSNNPSFLVQNSSYSF